MCHAYLEGIRPGSLNPIRLGQDSLRFLLDHYYWLSFPSIFSSCEWTRRTPAILTTGFFPCQSALPMYYMAVVRTFSREGWGEGKEGYDCFPPPPVAPPLPPSPQTPRFNSQPVLPPTDGQQRQASLLARRCKSPLTLLPANGQQKWVSLLYKEACSPPIYPA